VLPSLSWLIALKAVQPVEIEAAKLAGEDGNDDAAQAMNPGEARRDLLIMLAGSDQQERSLIARPQTRRR